MGTSFVVGSSPIIEDRGRRKGGGFVLPAEISHRCPLLFYEILLRIFYNKINIISFEKLVFRHSTKVVLTLRKDGTNEHNIEHIELRR
jgi:hypothetical protein